MRSVTSLTILVIGCLLFTGCAEMQKVGQDIGHGSRDATKAIGHATRDATKAIGHATRDATKTIGHKSREAAEEISKDLKDKPDPKDN